MELGSMDFDVLPFNLSFTVDKRFHGTFFHGRCRAFMEVVLQPSALTNASVEATSENLTEVASTKVSLKFGKGFDGQASMEFSP